MVSRGDTDAGGGGDGGVRLRCLSPDDVPPETGRHPVDDLSKGGIGIYDGSANGRREVQTPLKRQTNSVRVAGWVVELTLAALLLSTTLVIAVVIVPALNRWEESLRDREDSLHSATLDNTKQTERMEKSRKFLIRQQTETLILQDRLHKAVEATLKKVESNR